MLRRYVVAWIICYQLLVVTAHACHYWGDYYYVVDPALNTPVTSGSTDELPYQFDSDEAFLNEYLGENNWRWATGTELTLSTDELVENPDHTRYHIKIKQPQTTDYQMQVVARTESRVHHFYGKEYKRTYGSKYAYNVIVNANLNQKVTFYKSSMRLFSINSLFVIVIPEHEGQWILVSRPASIKANYCGGELYVPTERETYELNKFLCQNLHDYEKETACSIVKETERKTP